MSANAFHEYEFKLDAPSDDELRRAQAWVQNTPEIFTKRRSRTPAAMQGLFQRPLEITGERVRLYYDTIDLAAAPMMDRMEYPCALDEFGVCFDDIDDKNARRILRREFEGHVFKPVIAMVSQRTRLKYHPEGDTDILIEAAFDYPCWGFTMNGFIWKAPEMELELVAGPHDAASAHKVLEREAMRFEERFDLQRTLTSKPTPGFEALRPYLGTTEGKRAFRALKADQEWWMAPAPARTEFAATISGIARRVAAG